MCCGWAAGLTQPYLLVGPDANDGYLYTLNVSKMRLLRHLHLNSTSGSLQFGANQQLGGTCCSDNNGIGGAGAVMRVTQSLVQTLQAEPLLCFCVSQRAGSCVFLSGENVMVVGGAKNSRHPFDSAVGGAQRQRPLFLSLTYLLLFVAAAATYSLNSNGAPVAGRFPAIGPNVLGDGLWM